MGSWHEERVRVRFEETDMMGVVYYAKFFVWLEVGRISLMRDIGFTVGEWDRRGVHIPVVQAHADYRSSARIDDQILVKTRVARVGNSSIKFENEVYKLPEMKLLCTGHTVHAMVDSKGKSTRVPDEVRSALEES